VVPVLLNAPQPDLPIEYAKMTVQPTEVVSASDPGQSYYYSGDTWHDLYSDDQTANFCIKALSKNNATASVLLKAKLYLQGCYNTTTGQMTSTQSLPLESPYSQSERTVSDMPPDIVDWVLIHLKNQADEQPVYSKSALLRNDGQIVADNGTTEGVVLNVAEGDYYVILSHRNHLDVMSAQAVHLAGTASPVLDFTSSGNACYGSTAPVQLTANVWGLRAGDINQDGLINTADYTLWYNDQVNQLTGYLSSDLDMDAFIDENDYSLWESNASVGPESGIPE
jgi:hypothetical protein